MPCEGDGKVAANAALAGDRFAHQAAEYSGEHCPPLRSRMPELPRHRLGAPEMLSVCLGLFEPRKDAAACRQWLRELSWAGISTRRRREWRDNGFSRRAREAS